jgi:nitroimidazol reductase NimA-like FMN-containing flavoprotein (pyridoxamine 5'-phosphate oxidase superfamily)
MVLLCWVDEFLRPITSTVARRRLPVSAVPDTRFQERFSSPDASAMPWPDAEDVLRDAEIYWVTTVRPDGRPHVTPLVAVWLGDALYFCTGEDERKALNLRANPSCVMTTGCNAFRSGTDIVLEGTAARVADDTTLQRVADALLTKYEWPYRVAGGALEEVGRPDEGDARGSAIVFRVVPKKVFAYTRGSSFSATRYRF